MAESKCYRIVAEVKGKKKVFYVWADCPMNATCTLQNKKVIGYQRPKSITLKKEFNGLFPENTYKTRTEFEEIKIKKNLEKVLEIRFFEIVEASGDYKEVFLSSDVRRKIVDIIWNHNLPRSDIYDVFSNHVIGSGKDWYGVVVVSNDTFFVKRTNGTYDETNWKPGKEFLENIHAVVKQQGEKHA